MSKNQIDLLDRMCVRHSGACARTGCSYLRKSAAVTEAAGSQKRLLPHTISGSASRSGGLSAP
jgi:hypothetical protein